MPQHSAEPTSAKKLDISKFHASLETVKEAALNSQEQ
jgi:hypothetical protein